MTENHRQLRELLGAYVLDQLDEPTRATVHRHLDGCAECRAEVTSLGPVAQALRGLDPTAAQDITAPDHLGDQIVRRKQELQLAASRRARLRRGVGGLLVAASVAAAFGLGSWFSGPRNDPPVVAVDLDVVAAGVQADAGLVKHTWGTELKLQATGLDDGASYAVTFSRDDGSQVSAGTFLGTGARAVRCSVNAAVPIDDAAELIVTDGRGTVVMDADLR